MAFEGMLFSLGITVCWILCLTTEQSQSASYMTDSSERMLSKQGYADLVKASWILIDVIAQHPQLNLLGSDVRCDAELLAEVGNLLNYL